MKRFRGLSTRRKVLFAILAGLLVSMLGLRALGVAGFNGTEVRDMDWDSDGAVTQAEILHGYTAVVVDETSDGKRSCRHYARLRDRSQVLRVDCRVEFAPAAP